jgi:hypothetical protein
VHREAHVAGRDGAGVAWLAAALGMEDR